MTLKNLHLVEVSQEDANGEKLTVKKWWIFGADFFTVWCRFFHGLRRFFTVCKGHKRWKKTSRYRWAFSRLVFHGLPPLEFRPRNKIFNPLSLLQISLSCRYPRGTCAPTPASSSDTPPPCLYVQWADPGVLWKKAPQSNESYERENPWNRTISTVLWVHKKLPQSTVKLVLPSNESYESKTGCNRTLATVLWVPLIQ